MLSIHNASEVGVFTRTFTGAAHGKELRRKRIPVMLPLTALAIYQ